MVLLIIFLFYGGWMVFFGFIVWILYGKGHIQLDETGLTCYWSILFFKGEKHIPIESLNKFELSVYYGKYGARYYVTAGPLVYWEFGRYPKKKIELLVDELNTFLENLQQT
jgi:hypothetical protein